MEERRCTLCVTLIPRYRAFCRHCFDRVPWKLRSDFLRAWLLRVADPNAYQQELIRLHLWDVDSRAVPGEWKRNKG